MLQQQPLKAPSIFIGIDERRVPPVLIIHGLTWPKRGVLGYKGLGCIWKPEKKSWEKAFSLHVVETLESWHDAAFSPELKRYLEGTRERDKRLQEDCNNKAKQQQKTQIKPSRSEEKKTCRRLISETGKEKEKK